MASSLGRYVVAFAPVIVLSVGAVALLAAVLTVGLDENAALISGFSGLDHFNNLHALLMVKNRSWMSKR
jgi:hypothetical protein